MGFDIKVHSSSGMPEVSHVEGLILATLPHFLLNPAFYFKAKYSDQGWMIMLTSLLGSSINHSTVCVLTVAPNGKRFVYAIISKSNR